MRIYQVKMGPNTKGGSVVKVDLTSRYNKAFYQAVLSRQGTPLKKGDAFNIQVKYPDQGNEAWHTAALVVYRLARTESESTSAKFTVVEDSVFEVPSTAMFFDVQFPEPVRRKLAPTKPWQRLGHRVQKTGPTLEERVAILERWMESFQA